MMMSNFVRAGISFSQGDQGGRTEVLVLEGVECSPFTLQSAHYRKEYLR